MTNQEITIRDFQEEDYLALMDLWTKLGLSRPERGDDLKVIEETLRLGGKLLVAESENNIIGSAWITNNGRRLYLHHMGVLGDLQGQGIGQMLMDFVNDFAAEKQLQIKLEVHQKNQNAQKLYRSNGFTLLEGYDVLIRRNF